MKAIVCQKENLARFVELYNQISLEDPFTGQRSLSDFQRDYGRGFEHNVLMIKSADTHLGFLFWSEQRGGVVTIEQLFLLPEYRGQGYEEELLAQLIHRYRDSGKKAIQSMISAPNLATGDCYRRLGFVETSQNMQMGLPVSQLAQNQGPTFPSGVEVVLAERAEWQEGRVVYRGLAREDDRYQLRSWNDVKEGSRLDQGKGCFLLKSTDQPIGVLTLNIYPLYENGQVKQVGQIYELGIISKMRQQGLGRELLQAGLNWGLEHGVEEFRIHLNGLYQPGVRFLASEGFRIKRVISSFTYSLLSEQVAI